MSRNTTLDDEIKLAAANLQRALAPIRQIQQTSTALSETLASIRTPRIDLAETLASIQAPRIDLAETLASIRTTED